MAADQRAPIFWGTSATDYRYPTTSTSIADAEAQLHHDDAPHHSRNGSIAYAKSSSGANSTGHRRRSWQPRAANLEMILTSGWYIFVSTGAVLALVLVLAASTVLLGVHLGISQARGAFTEVLRGGAAGAGTSGILGGSQHGGNLLM